MEGGGREGKKRQEFKQETILGLSKFKEKSWLSGGKRTAVKSSRLPVIKALVSRVPL